MAALLWRLGGAALVLLGLSFAGFALIGLMPGDPIDLMRAASPTMTADDVARLRALEGLDRPLGERYLAWLGAALAGDLGLSRLHAAPVAGVLAAPLGRTLLLAGAALLLALAAAVPLGVAAAGRPGGLADRAVGVLSTTALALPVFWLGIMLIVLFAVRLGWLPPGGPPPTHGGLLEAARHLLLPALTLAVGLFGPYVRHVRAAVREVLHQDWVRTARAKGVGPLRLLAGHVLPAAAAPLVTLLALDAGALLSGALVTETVFAWPGMGKLTYDAVMGNDYALALACLLLAAAVTLAANALADAAYGWLDPRTRERRGGSPGGGRGSA